MTLEKFRKKRANYLSTIMGCSIAVAEAYLVIDWASFDIKKEYPKLICIALTAIGGYMTSINIIQNKN